LIDALVTGLDKKEILMGKEVIEMIRELHAGGKYEGVCI
jgi:hypothetical protein